MPLTLYNYFVWCCAYELTVKTYEIKVRFTCCCTL